jgi:hypothetical protein
MVIIGAWFLLNLAIAVITNKFSEEHENKLENKKNGKNKSAKVKRFGADDESDEDAEDLDQSIDHMEAIDNMDILPEEKRARKEKQRL